MVWSASSARVAASDTASTGGASRQTRSYCWAAASRNFASFGERRTASGSDTGVPGAMRESVRSEEHTSELQSLMRISYAVFCLKKKRTQNYMKLVKQDQ